MSTFELCQKCRRSARRAAERCLPGFSLCKECVEERLESLSPIFRDRSYRAHLARRVWGIPCDKSSNCPEEPRGHATYKVFGQDITEKRAYQCMVVLVSSQFARPQNDRSITAFELLAGHHLVPSVKYCPTCLSKAMVRFPETNSLIALCNACSRKRKDHVETVHSGQDQFSEPWEKEYRLSLSGIGRPWELNGHDEQGFDDLIKRCFTPSLRGGAGEWSPAVIIALCVLLANAATAITFGMRTWLQQNRTAWHNNAMLELAIRQISWTVVNDNRNFRLACAQFPEYQAAPHDRSDLDGLNFEQIQAYSHRGFGVHDPSTLGSSNPTSGHHSSIYTGRTGANQGAGGSATHSWTGEGNNPNEILPRYAQDLGDPNHAFPSAPGPPHRTFCQQPRNSWNQHATNMAPVPHSNDPRTTNNDIQLAVLAQPLRQAPSSGFRHHTGTSTIASGTPQSSTSRNVARTGEHQSSALHNPETATSSFSPQPASNRSSSRSGTSSSGRGWAHDLRALLSQPNNTTTTFTPLPRTDRNSAGRPTRPEGCSPTGQSSAAPSNLHLRQVVSESSAASTRVPTESRRRYSVPESDNLYGTYVEAMYPDPTLPPTAEDTAERSRSRRANRHQK
jgi:hypothetical protein